MKVITLPLRQTLEADSGEASGITQADHDFFMAEGSRNMAAQMLRQAFADLDIELPASDATPEELEAYKLKNAEKLENCQSAAMWIAGVYADGVSFADCCSVIGLSQWVDRIVTNGQTIKVSGITDIAAFTRQMVMLDKSRVIEALDQYLSSVRSEGIRSQTRESAEPLQPESAAEEEVRVADARERTEILH